MDRARDADRYNFACVLAAQLDDKQGALNLLERTLASGGEMELRMAESDPDFGAIRDDRRFKDMLARARKRLGIEAPVAAGASQVA